MSDIESKKRELEAAQRSEKGDGAAKAADSIAQIEDPEERLERSWDFLTYITEKVSALPQDVQDKIMEIGRQLSAAGTSYNHTVPNPHRKPRSPAKEEALNNKNNHSPRQ